MLSIRSSLRTILVASVSFLTGYSSIAIPEPAPNALPIAAMGSIISGRPNDFSDPSRATFTVTSDMSGARAILRQFVQNATVQFESFDIGRNARVDVIHPSDQARTIALIAQQNPSQLFGVINVTTTSGGNGGELFLLNQNGFVFGPSFRLGSIDISGEVNQVPNGFVASSLDLNPAAENGVDLTRIIEDGQAAFIPHANGDSGKIEILRGAEITVADEGRIYLAAPIIINRGKLNAPLGEILAVAGNKVYLQSDEDGIGGVLAEVEVGGTVENLGEITSDQGIVTLLGKTVNQSGLITATTSVEIGGRIRLIARDDAELANLQNENPSFLQGAGDGGELILGENSITQVIIPDDVDLEDERTDEIAQPRSTIELFGEQIILDKDSLVSANSGTIRIVNLDETDESGEITTVTDFGNNQNIASNVNPNAFVQINDGATIDVSGLNITRSDRDLFVTTNLQSAEFSNFPLNREALNPSEVTLDLSRGTSIADITSSINNLTFDVEERNLAGGDIFITSEGLVTLEDQSLIDISGGSTTFVRDGPRLASSYVIQSNGIVNRIEDADPNRAYVGVLQEESPLAGLLNLLQFRGEGVMSMAELNGTLANPEIFRVIGRSSGTLSINAPFLDLRGEIDANTTIGEFQTEFDQLTRGAIRSNNAALANLSVPLGGRLVLGNFDATGALGANTTRVNEIEIVSNNSDAGLQGDIADFSSTKINLPQSLFNSTGSGSNITEALIGANQKITIPTNTAIVGADEASIELVSSNVQIDGDIRLPGGDLEIEILQPFGVTSDLSAIVANTANIDLSGNRIFTRDLGQVNTNTLNGGNFSIDFNSTFTQRLEIQSGANIDVSAGYFVSSSELEVGNAGSISLSPNSGDGGFDIDIDLNVFKGYGAVVSANGETQVGRGGSFSTIINGDLCIASRLCDGLDSDNVFQVLPEYFQSSGFDDLSFITAIGAGQSLINGVAIIDDTINLQSDTRVVMASTSGSLFSPTFVGNPTIMSFEPVEFRTPTNLNISAVNELTLNRGASLNGEIGSSVSLTSNQFLYIDGQINAPGGVAAFSLNPASIGIDLAGNVSVGSSDPSQAIWFGSNASVNVNSAFVPSTSTALGQFGEIVDAGLISIDANAGYVITESGSSLSATGSTALANRASVIIDNSSALMPMFQEVTLLGNAGTIAFEAAEGILFGADINLQSGLQNVGPAGVLAISLDPRSRGNAQNSGILPDGDGPDLERFEPNLDNSFSQDARIIRITSNDLLNLPADLNPGENIAQALFEAHPDFDPTLQVAGEAIPTLPTLISQSYINDSGAGSLRFETIDRTARLVPTVVGNPTPVAFTVPSEIQVENGVNLQVANLIELNTSTLTGPGVMQGSATVTSDIIRFGSDFGSVNNPDNNRKLPTARADTTDSRLRFNANLIDIFGFTAVADLSQLTLQSSGDIRLIGTSTSSSNNELPGSPTEPQGNLDLVGVDLNLSAQQIYATTLSDFTINNIDSETGQQAVVRTNKALSANGADSVLSAASSLTINATEFEHGGVLRAPLGSITVNSENITLLDGSIVSTNANDQLIPFGRVLLGEDLVVSFNGQSNNQVIFGADPETDRPLPEKNITLTAENIDSQEGSIIDISGGGDLFSSEFLSSFSGTIDFLNNDNAGDSFAIIPTQSLSYAPIDVEFSPGFNAEIGETVELDGALFGLSPGNQRFVKLPAIYALLPGGYLVTPQDSFSGLQRGQNIAQLDGSVITAGRTVFSNSAVTPNNLATEAFLLESQVNLIDRGLYNTFTINEFAQNPNVGGNSRLPQDAGVLTLQANQNLNLAGTLFGNGVSSGIDSELRIASDQIALVNENSDLNNFEDFLTIQETQFNSFGASTIILGAVDTELSDSISENVISNQIIIDNDIEIAVPELVLAAKGELDAGANIEIGDGVSINTITSESNISTRAFQVNEDAAVFIASGLNQWDVEVTNPSDVPISSISAGGIDNSSNITASQSIVFSANDFTFDLNNVESGGDFVLNTSAVNFGDMIPVDEAGTAISDEQLLAINAESLIFNVDSINVFGQANIGFVNSEDANGVNQTNVLVNNLTINTQSINASPDSTNIGNTLGFDSVLNIKVNDTFTLASSENSANPAYEGASNLSVEANNILIAMGDVQLNGFAKTEFIGTNSIQLIDSGSLNTTADIEFITNRFDIGSGVDYSIQSTAGDFLLSRFDQALASANSNAFNGILEITANQTISIDSFVNARSGIINLDSETGQISFGANSFIDLSGVELVRGPETLLTAGGILNVDAATDVEFLEGSSVDLRGARSIAEAGALNIEVATSNGLGEFTFNAEVFGESQSRSQGGKFYLDLPAFNATSFSELNDTLNAGGFTGSRAIRSRAGDLILNSDQLIDSTNVVLAADTGEITIAGSIAASSTEGGSVKLYANENVTITETAVIDARTLSESEFIEGQVLLSSVDGFVDLDQGSQINLSRVVNSELSDGGELYIRVDRNNTNDAVNIAENFNTELINATRVRVEALELIQSGTTGSIQAQVTNSSNDFGSSIGTIETQLESELAVVGTEVDVQVSPGFEITSNADITVDSDWDLSSIRVGTDADGNALNRAPVITLRASENLNINQSITDGFTQEFVFNQVPDEAQAFLPPIPSAVQLLLEGDSSSIRLIAGADLSAANFTQTRADGVGDITLAPGQAPNPISFAIQDPFADPTVIRTGNGDIDVFTAGDLIFGNQYSNIFTSGVPYTGRENEDGSVDEAILLLGLDTLEYPDQAGDVTVQVGGNIVGSDADKNPNDFIFRTGNEFTYSFDENGQPEILQFESSTGYTVNTGFFNHELGVLGGGRLNVTAGGDITNVGIALPSVGVQVGGTTLETNDVEVIGGGNLELVAGGDIVGGSYVLGNGDSNITTYGSFGSADIAADSIAITGAPNLQVNAFRDLSIGHIYSPTLLPSTAPQANTTSPFFVNTESFFSSVSEQSSVALTSFSGNLKFFGTTESFLDEVGLVDDNVGDFLTVVTRGLTVGPSSLALTALNGGIEFDRDVLLQPSTNSSVRLIAEENIDFALSAEILLPDIDPANFIGLTNPASDRADLLSTSQPYNSVLTQLARDSFNEAIDLDRNSSVPLHAQIGADGSIDNEPSVLISNSGSITFDNFAEIEISEQFRLFAGQDLVGANITVQNNRPTDVTQFVIGNDLLFNTDIELIGGAVRVSPVQLGIAIDGPGRADFITGGNIDLGTSQGIFSRGNEVNPNLADDGADINFLVGIDPRSFDERVERFADEFIINPNFANSTRADVLNNIHNQTLEDYLVKLGEELIEVLGSSITDPSDINQFALISDNQLIEPLLGLDAQDIQSIYLLGLQGAASNVSTQQQREIYANLNSIAQYEVVQQAFLTEIYAGGNASSVALAAPTTFTALENLSANNDTEAIISFILSQAPAEASFGDLSGSDEEVLASISEGLSDLLNPEISNVTLDSATTETVQLLLNEVGLLQTQLALGFDVERGRLLAGAFEEYQRTFDAVTAFYPEHTEALEFLVGTDGVVTRAINTDPNFSGSDLVDVINYVQGEIDANGFSIDEQGSRDVNLTSFPSSIVETATTAEEGAENLPGLISSLNLQQRPDLFIDSDANLNAFFSGLFSRDAGDINIIVPFGFINGGIATPPSDIGLNKGPEELGIIAAGGANANIFVSGDLLINQSRLVGVGSGIQALSLFDNLDAGSGFTTAVAAALPQIFIDDDGRRTLIFPDNFSGSGIRTLVDRDGNEGSISLFTPLGEVVSGDAGISSSNALSISALDVVGTNVDSGGASTVSSGGDIAVPQVTTSVDPGTSATRSAEEGGTTGGLADAAEQSSLAAEAATFLNVVVLGVGG